MALFKITSELPIGLSHFGEFLLPAESTVELTEDEVRVLVANIVANKSIDVEDLGLPQSCPAIYEKLKIAYRQMAQKAEEKYWLWEGYEKGYLDYDIHELMDYCLENCGFRFDYDYNEYLDAEGDFDEEIMEEAKCMAFQEWLDAYLFHLEDDQFLFFMHNQMDVKLDVNYVRYRVEIPEAIVQMARIYDESISK